MKPINSPKTPCTNTPSGCIIWDGPDLSCIGVCNGNSVTEVVYKIASELCTLMDQLNISNYDLKCIEPATCLPADFKAFIQLLINKVCALDAATAAAVSGTTNGCPNCVVPLQPCFQYTDPSNGNLVTTGLLQDYIQLIAIQVCTLIQQGTTQNAGLQNLNKRVTTIENTPPPTYQLPDLFPTVIGNPNVALPLDVFAQKTEALLGQLIGATGTSSRIFNAIATPAINGLNAQDAVGTPGQRMSSLPSWNPDVKTAADSIENLWVAVMDLRKGVSTIQLNCCGSTCNDIGVDLQVTMESSTTLKFFFTGTIPTNFQNCLAGGALIKIADQSGHYINVTIDVKATLNDPTGFSVLISGTPLVVTDDFTITGTLCFYDANTGTQCQSPTSFYLVNTLDCPLVTWTPSQTAVTYSFNHTGGSLTYTVQLLDAGNNPIAVQSYVVTGPTVISGTFNSLSPNTLYKGRVQMITSTQTKTCPFTTITTGPDHCAAIQELTSTITIP